MIGEIIVVAKFVAVVADVAADVALVTDTAGEFDF